MNLPRAIASSLTLAIPIALLIGSVCLVVSCTRDSSTQGSQQQSMAIEKSVEKGPVSLTITADRDRATVGENFTLTLNVLAEPNVVVRMPQLQQQLGPFEIVQSHTPPDIPDSNRRRWIHRYTLRCFEAGTHAVSDLTVKFADQRSGKTDASIESEIVAPRLEIAIDSLIAGEFNPQNYRDIKQPVEIALPLDSRLWLLLAAAVLALAGVVGFMILRSRRPQHIAAPPPPLPHVWALQQLDLLAQQQLLARGQLHEYFFQLSAIVREYIERRFSIRAAEQTTEEFLREARNHHALTDSHRALLTTFLRQADMVKFAKLQPPQHESEQAMITACRFIEETAATSPEPDDGASSPPPPAAHWSNTELPVEAGRS